MKALTLYQPWASLLVYGYKRIETRSWRTTYRGPLVIHASTNATSMPHLLQCLNRRQIPQALRDLPYPTGALLGQVELIHVAPTDWLLQGEHAISAQEQDLGDYGPGRYGWICRDPQAFAAPVVCKGALGLWTVPDATLAQCRVATAVSP